jgi:hypothetical protein
MIAFLAGPSFQDGSDPWVAALATEQMETAKIVNNKYLNPD